jgi:hypothetical protein
VTHKLTPQSRAILSLIQSHMAEMQDIVGEDYQLTLVARYTKNPELDADILLTNDDPELVKQAIDKNAKLPPTDIRGDVIT